MGPRRDLRPCLVFAISQKTLAWDYVAPLSFAKPKLRVFAKLG